MEFTEAWDHTCSSVGMAVRMGNVNVLRRLLKEGKPVDVQDNRGWRALHEAAAHNQLECIEELLIHGVDINWQNYESETALILACEKGNSKIVQKLLEHGADPNINKLDGTTTLIAAIQANNVACVDLLLNHDVNVNSTDWTNWSAVHHASEVGDVNSLTLLSSHNANLNSTQDLYMRSPLFIAAENGNLDCVKFLTDQLTGGGDCSAINKTTSDGMAALGIAAQNGHFDCVEFLLQHGADINYETPDGGLLAVHFAVTCADIRCFNSLLHRTDFNILTKSTVFSILHLAVDRKHHAVISTLLENHFPVDRVEAVPDLELTGDELTRRFVLRHIRDDSSYLYITALGLAARNDDMVAVQLLLDAGASCNGAIESCIPPLVAAVWGGNPEIVSKLLSNGSNVNYCLLSRVPIAAVIAVHERKWNILELLLRSGAHNFSFQENRSNDFLWHTIENFVNPFNMLEKVLLILWRYEDFNRWQKMYSFARTHFPTEDDEWLRNPELQSLTTQPPSLQYLSRTTVRETLILSRPSLQESDVIMLPLPQTLRDHILHN